ncbi:hypothetical protein LCGC14_0635080 [marine sediment metagenome]|uniref:Glycosyl hydrolase family 13 catalytic domain-containing protein n=1 Tax=marine sediment metagenome TaxID=412755 RepID=A0A0F9RK53_9ZZZZ
MNFQNTKWVKHPKILEINTWVWLESLSHQYGEIITFDNIPDDIIDEEISLFDAVWFMGVWERSPKGREIALHHSDLQMEYRRALPDFKAKDVVGSPYAVHNYHIDTHLGVEDGLARFRNRLLDKNILIILDYVPNHVAIDHSWVLEDPDIFIKGTLEDITLHHKQFFKMNNQIFAHGLDPYFFDSPWTDTIQINAFSEEARQKTINALLSIARLCDGVRCDMAMLLTNNVFSRTWGEKVGSPPEKDFWEEVIQAVKEKFPNFLFIAEVYWDMEWELQQQGFDLCYDKRLYERLAHENAYTVKEHLRAEWDYQSKLIRFIENHDELRAIEKFGEERSRAAATIVLTLPGGRLVYEGQTRGFKVKLPVQLGRSPFEEENSNLLKFYHLLLKTMPTIIFKNANWSLCELESIGFGDSSYTNLISYLWEFGDFYRLIVVNFSPYPSKAHIKSEKLNYGVSNWNFTDLLIQRDFIYSGEDLSKFGLYVELSGWNAHIFSIKKYE